jgi:hypothetical protein
MEHVDILEDPDGAPYPEEVQVMWGHIQDVAVTITREPTRETVVAALESVAAATLRDVADSSGVLTYPVKETLRKYAANIERRHREGS